MQPRHNVAAAFVWEDGANFQPDVHDFADPAAGVQPEFPCTATSPVLKFFTAFFDLEVMQYLVQEINNYRAVCCIWTDTHHLREASNMKSWSDVTVEELYVWLALTMLMPHIRKHVLQEYWIVDDMVSTPLFGKYMARDRYVDILRYLHFANNLGPAPNDRLWKVRSILEMIRGRMRKYFRPYQKVVIDESLILFRGRLSFIQYIPSKRHRFGIKFFVICDCQTGYVLDFLVYSGSDVDIPAQDPHGFSGAVVKVLMDSYFNNNHILYTDNYYTSPGLSNYLLQKKTGSCGTVRANRKHWPVFPAKTKKGDIFTQKSGKMLAIHWHDKRKVNMLTTVHQGAMQDSGKRERGSRNVVYKPDAVIDYNINMRLVDKSDMMIGAIDCLRRSCKWYKKAFLHLLDMTVLNSFILYRQVTKKTTSLRKFEKELVKELLTAYGKVLPLVPGTHLANRQLDRLECADWLSRHQLTLLPPLPSGRKGSRRCNVCYNTARRPKTRKETQYWCLECKIPLCPGCFVPYHTLDKF